MGFDPKMNADDFRDGLDGGFGLGTYSRKRRGGERDGPSPSRPEEERSSSEELDLALPPAAAGKSFRSIKTFHTRFPGRGIGPQRGRYRSESS